MKRIFIALLTTLCLISLNKHAGANDLSGDPEDAQYKKMASALGFDGYVELSGLRLRQNEMGDEKLRKKLIVVDEIAKNFKATQYAHPLVFYGGYHIGINHYEKVAVYLPDRKNVRKGEFINMKTLYSFDKSFEATTVDGFKTKVLVIKPIQQTKFKFN